MLAFILLANFVPNDTNLVLAQNEYATKGFPIVLAADHRQRHQLCIALAAISNAHAAKVFMPGGSVAQENTEF